MTGAKRESKGQFWQRVQQEGRLAQAQAVEADLLLQRLSRRHVQKVLVSRFQPVDGTLTRAWPTPDSWECGRRYARKPVSAAEQYEDNLLWAWNNLGQVRPEEAPDARKRSLLLLAEQKPADFHRKYQRALPGITRRQEVQEEERRRRWEELEWERLRPQRKEQERKQREAKRKRQWRLKKRQQRELEKQAEQERQKQQAEQDRKDRERKERREATLAVLRERRTTEGSNRYEHAIDPTTRVHVQTSYRLLVPAWPNKGDQDVIGSPEADAWLIELEKANEQRRIAAEREAREALPARIAEHMAGKRKQREAEQEMKQQENERLILESQRREQELMGRILRVEEVRRRAQN